MVLVLPFLPSDAYPVAPHHGLTAHVTPHHGLTPLIAPRHGLAASVSPLSHGTVPAAIGADLKASGGIEEYGHISESKQAPTTYPQVSTRQLPGELLRHEFP